MRGVNLVVELAVTLRRRDGRDLVLVMRGAAGLVRDPAGQALPLEQAGQLRMGRVVVECPARELAEVGIAARGHRHAGGKLR